MVQHLLGHRSMGDLMDTGGHRSRLLDLKAGKGEVERICHPGGPRSTSAPPRREVEQAAVMASGAPEGPH